MQNQSWIKCLGFPTCEQVSLSNNQNLYWHGTFYNILVICTVYSSASSSVKALVDCKRNFRSSFPKLLFRQILFVHGEYLNPTFSIMWHVLKICVRKRLETNTIYFFTFPSECQFFSIHKNNTLLSWLWTTHSFWKSVHISKIQRMKRQWKSNLISTICSCLSHSEIFRLLDLLYLTEVDMQLQTFGLP